MKRFYLLSALLLVFFVSPSLLADPIEDLSMKNYQAGWFPNFYKDKGPLTCAETCKIWTSTRQESEQSTDIDGQSKHASVCKITRDKEIVLKPINDPASHWIYGNQFDDWPVCHVSSLGYGEVRSELYFCECVRPLRNPCTGPDLIISKIHNPDYDPATGESVINVDVQNIGASLAGVSDTTLSDPGRPFSQTVGTPAIAAGATVTITFRFPYWVYDPDAELEAKADSNQKIDECKEDNNTLSFFGLG